QNRQGSNCSLHRIPPLAQSNHILRAHSLTIGTLYKRINDLAAQFAANKPANSRAERSFSSAFTRSITASVRLAPITGNMSSRAFAVTRAVSSGLSFVPGAKRVKWLTV